MNYAIFRSEPIYTLNDLVQIGSHNKREKKAYNSNPNIKLELTKDNIEIVLLQAKLRNIMAIKILIVMMFMIFLKGLQKKMNYLNMLMFLVV